MLTGTARSSVGPSPDTKPRHPDACQVEARVWEKVGGGRTATRAEAEEIGGGEYGRDCILVLMTSRGKLDECEVSRRS